MIGNDIVDIAEARIDSNWRRPRFLEKLFTKKEQQIILNSEDPFIMVWQFWSMKEAAYKLYIQQNPNRFYAPKQFECSANASTWNVHYKDFTCHVSTQTTADYIISEARLTPHKIASEVVVFKDANSKTQSAFLKEKLIENISEGQDISASDIYFQKSEYGVPSVYFNSRRIDISLTHHGRFGAFVFDDFVSSSAVERF